MSNIKSGAVMLTFHNNPAIKAEYVARARTHRKADQIRQGFGYWKKDGDEFRGCAVGCTIHSSNHADYENLLGVPMQIAYLEDRIFETLPSSKAMKWPEAFLRAIPVGVDLRPAYWRFMIWLLIDPVDGVEQLAFDDGKKSCREVAALYQILLDGGAVEDDQWRRVTAEAAEAAWAAEAARAAWAAEAAEAARAAWAAEAAEAAGAAGAARAARAAEAAGAAGAARAARAAEAAWAAEAARAAWAARPAGAARAAERQADKLLHLMKECGK